MEILVYKVDFVICTTKLWFFWKKIPNVFFLLYVLSVCDVIIVFVGLIFKIMWLFLYMDFWLTFICTFKNRSNCMLSKFKHTLMFQFYCFFIDNNFLSLHWLIGFTYIFIYLVCWWHYFRIIVCCAIVCSEAKAIGCCRTKIRLLNYWVFDNTEGIG